jgi:hypothetical protein
MRRSPVLVRIGCWFGTLFVSLLLLLAASSPATGQASPSPEGHWATARLSQPRARPFADAPAAAVVGTRVLFAGGGVRMEAPEVVDIYDAATGQWTTSRPPHPGPIVLVIPVGSGVLAVWGYGP